MPARPQSPLALAPGSPNRRCPRSCAHRRASPPTSRSGARTHAAMWSACSRSPAPHSPFGGVAIRLVRAQWAAPGEGGDGPVLSADDRMVASFPMAEAIRPDARIEIAALQQNGYATWLLSGDSPERVARFAAALGIPRALGGLKPED